MRRVRNQTHRWLLALWDPRGPTQDLDWAAPSPAAQQALLELADRHGVLAIVMHHLKQRVQPANRLWPCFEPAAWEWGQQRLRRRAALCLALRQQAQQLAISLQRAGVPTLVLKGCDFADRLYPHPSWRPFTDVDLLIPHRLLAETQAVFGSLGYEPVASQMKYATGYGEESWRRPEQLGGTVEIHWNLVNSPALREALSVAYEDLQVEQYEQRSRPSAAAVLLIAAVHGVASHGLDRLQVLGDVIQAVRGMAGALDKVWLAQALARTGTDRTLATALALAEKLAEEPACGDLMAELGIERKAWPGKLLLTRGVVLRAHAPADSFRRQLLRQFLKY